MSRRRARHGTRRGRFPRVSGDEPPLNGQAITTWTFSPRERG